MNTVLIVEDEKMIRQGIKTMVQRSGVPIGNILECNNGQLAYEILQKEKVDVMFTDIRMPKMDGIELVSKVRELPRMPLIVAVSGYDDFSYAVEMLRGGVREYLLKPVERDKIKEILEKFELELQQKSGEEEELKRIGRQQLKYVMTGEVTSREMQTVAEWFDGKLVSRDYYILCTQMQDEKEEEAGSYIYWNDIEKNSVYIIMGDDLNRFLEEDLAECHTGISERHSGVEELKKAFSEAKEARKEAFCTGRNEVRYEEQESEQKRADAEKMRQLAQQIGTTRIEESLKSIRQIIKDTKRRKYPVPAFEASIASLLDAICSIYQSAIPGVVEDTGKFRDIYGFSDIDSFAEELEGWLMVFHDRLDAEFDDYKNKQKILDAVSYIRENYAKDLNMAVVSNYVSMNYSLFSYLFKQYTGNNFVNYLKELRIDQAKKMLAETEWRVAEISHKVGYENEKHFMKIFRNICGVSPTEYRKTMQLSG